MLLVEDRALLQRFRAGDRDALETVYRHYAPNVAQFLRMGFSFHSGGRRCHFRGTRSQFDLEDRVHDVFCRAFADRARRGYDGLSPYRAYLHGIARNLVIDDFRRKENANLEEGTVPELAEPAIIEAETCDPLAGAVDVSGDPDRDVERVEVVGLVANFKDSLPDREQAVFQLRFEQEQSHDQIFAATGLSPSKIKTSEDRIRAGFFDYMQEHGYFYSRRAVACAWRRRRPVLSEQP